MSFTDLTEIDVLDGIFQDPSFSGYANLWVGLSTTTPTDAGANFGEPSGGGYSRVTTTSASWNAASAGAKDNGSIITFPTASADWDSGNNMTYFGLFDALAGGNLVLYGALGTAKPVLNGDTATFAAQALTITLT